MFGQPIGTFCGYQIHKKLGKGAFGQVHVAVNPANNDVVAMKFIEQSAAGLQIESVRKEQDCLYKAAGHLNVTNLHADMLEGAFFDRPYFGIAMDYCAGGDLFDVIAMKGKFPEPAARFWFGQILDALEHCHGNGVYHRDIKPENIMFDAHFNIKLADFGLSASDDGSGGYMCDRAGTPAYMAPEVLARHPYDGAQADVWSASVVLFIMLMGSPPWRQCDAQDFFFKKIINTGNANTFWQYYTTKFAAYHAWTQESMDLLSSVFLPDPRHRAGIAQLRETAFMTAPPLSLAQITRDMDLSMAQMNDEMRLAEEGRTGVSRAVPPSGDLDISVQEEAPHVPLYKEHNVKSRTTRFCVRCAPSGAFTHIEGVLAGLEEKGLFTETKLNDFEMSYVYQPHEESLAEDEEPEAPITSNDPIEFTISIYRLGDMAYNSSATADEEFVVEFQRKKGDYFAFAGSVYRPVMLGLNAIISATFALDGTKILSASDLQ